MNGHSIFSFNCMSKCFSGEKKKKSQNISKISSEVVKIYDSLRIVSISGDIYQVKIFLITDDKGSLHLKKNSQSLFKLWQAAQLS